MRESAVAGKVGRTAGRPRLMISGSLSLAGRAVAVERDMIVLARDGRPVGKVAAVLVDEHGAADGVLLATLADTVAYHAIPAVWIAAVRAEAVLLAADQAAIAGLAAWSAE